jgi:hypothetical protein
MLQRCRITVHNHNIVSSHTNIINFMGDCRRPEFEWGLHKNNHNWPSAVADVRHFERHTMWRLYLTLGTRGFKKFCRMLSHEIAFDKSGTEQVGWSSSPCDLYLGDAWFASWGNTKYLTLLFMVCHSCSRQMAGQTLSVPSRLLVPNPF